MFQKTQAFTHIQANLKVDQMKFEVDYSKFQKKQIMFDNFIEDNPYHSSDAVFTHPENKNRIFIGDVQAALDFDFLKTNNIRTVVTAARDMDHIKYDSDILHIVYPLLDGKNEDIASFFDAFYNLIQTNIGKGSILVHCAAGISRSSTLVISYMMKFNKMSFKQAVAEVRKYRPTVLPNLGFERQLKKYQEQISGTSKISRISKRGQSKTAQSGQPHILMKTQLMPNFAALIRPTLKDKLRSGQIKQKTMQKDQKLVKIYNLPSREDSKQKKFVITKKAASFSKNPDHKGLIITNFREQIKKSNRELHRLVKTPLEQIKAAYLPRRALIERHVPTQRGNTFYNPINSKMQF